LFSEGESAAKGKLQPGDVIVAINGKPMTNKSHYQAWNQLKSLPEGPINLAVRRRGPLPPATLVWARPKIFTLSVPSRLNA